MAYMYSNKKGSIGGCYSSKEPFLFLYELEILELDAVCL